MKLNSVLTTLLFFVCFFAESAETQPASIYTKNGKVLEVDIGVYSQGIIITNSKIKYFNKGKKGKIALSQIDHIDLESKTYEVISYKKEIKTGPNRGITTLTLLVELAVNGKVKLYRAYSIQSNGGYMSDGVFVTYGGSSLVTTNYLVKDKLVKWTSKADFKKRIVSFFPDCDIVEKVENKQYRYRDLIQAIKYGNEKCD